MTSMHFFFNLFFSYGQIELAANIVSILSIQSHNIFQLKERKIAKVTLSGIPLLQL